MTQRWKVIVRRTEEREFEVTASINDRDILVHGALAYGRDSGDQIKETRAETGKWEIVGVEGQVDE